MSKQLDQIEHKLDRLLHIITAIHKVVFDLPRTTPLCVPYQLSETPKPITKCGTCGKETDSILSNEVVSFCSQSCQTLWYRYQMIDQKIETDNQK